MKIEFKPQGVCTKLIRLDIDDNIINSIEFYGGCEGNLKGISQLLQGMNVETVITKLEGITCGGKQTSCPDQIAKILVEYLHHIKNSVAEKG